MQKTNLHNAFKAAFPKTIPVLTGFLFLGAAYGMLMQKIGYGVLWSVPMSVICFCGSMQFVAITLLTTTFNPLQAFLLSIMVNARHFFYGLSMLKKYKGLKGVKWFLIYTLCDETFSIISALDVPKGIKRKHFYFAVSFLDYIYWIIGTLIGGLLGNYISFNTKGLDFALTALFIVLFLEQWKKNYKSALIGIISSVVCVVIFSANTFVIPAMILILLVIIGGKKKLCN